MRAPVLVLLIALPGCFLQSATYRREKAREAMDDLCFHGQFSQAKTIACSALDDNMGFGPDGSPLVTAAFVIHPYNGSVPWSYSHSLDLDVAAVQRALDADHVEPQIASAFLDQLRAARQELPARIAAMPPAWRQLYIDSIDEARARWQRDERRRAPWLAKLAPLIKRRERVTLEHVPDRSLIADLTALRRDYAADCSRAGVVLIDCLSDDVGWVATAEIERVAIAREDGTRAQAERELLKLPDHSQLPYFEHDFVDARVKAARASHDAYVRAKESGISAATLAERWPTPPTTFERVELPGDPPSGFDWDHNIWNPPDANEISIQVERVERRGDVAVLHARHQTSRVEENTGCYETNRIDSITDGHVNYREVCTGTRIATSDVTALPITVPWEEAAHIAPLDVVTTWIDKHRAGHVVEVRAGDRSHTASDVVGMKAGMVVQIGAFRLAPARGGKASDATAMRP